MEAINEFFKNLMDYISRMTPSQVMMLLGVIAGSIVGIIFIVGWLHSVTYAPLYTDLEESEAGEITSYLSDQKIPYQLSAGGKTIGVPSGDVYKTRIALASKGLPSSGNIGYAIFDKNNLGMTDFLQNLNYRRALEGELTKTIMQLNEVKAARVHIVMPKDRLFKKDQQEATASVVLKFRGAGGISKQQIQGITHLVASSVEGLKPSNISIIDYDGNLLSSNTESDPLAGLSSSQLEVRKQVEQYLQEKSQSMLDGVLGAGKSVIRVTADLNFQQIEKTSEQYDPNQPSVRSEERTKSSTTTADKSGDNSESKNDESNETVVTNYELNKTVEHIINSVGNIDRLSIAVLVDGKYVPAEGGDATTAPVYQPRSQEELDRLAAIVKNSVGFDQQRNDQIEMVNLPFDRNSLDEDRQFLDDMYKQDYYLEIGKKIGLVLLALVALFWLKRKSKKLFGTLSRLAPPPRPAVVQTPQPMQPIIQPEEDLPIVAEKRKPRLVDKMQQAAKEQPEEIARVIKTMMIE